MNSTKQRSHIVGMGIIIGWSFLAPLDGAATEHQVGQKTTIIESSSPPAASHPPIQPEEVEVAINALGQPIDNEQVSRIFEQLAEIQNPQERQRLQELLNERMQTPLSHSDSLPPAPIPDMSSGRASELGKPRSEEELRNQIQSLKLGANASADDLHARDEVVSAVIAISDPLKRDSLLKALEHREQEADSPSTSAPTP